MHAFSKGYQGDPEAGYARRRTCPRQESNLVPDLRRVVCESVTPRGRLHQGGRGGGRTRKAVRLARIPGGSRRRSGGPSISDTDMRKARDSNPHASSPGAHSLAKRPGQPYPAAFRAIAPVQWTGRGIEPRSPGCKPGVFPLDQPPMSPTVVPEGIDPPSPVRETGSGRRLLSLSPCSTHVSIHRKSW